MDMSQYRDLFLSETREHLNNMNRLVVTLEQEPGARETIDSLFREAHSIKGMAATMGFENTAALAHHLEDSLDACRTTGRIEAAAVDRLLAGIDLLEALLEDLTAARAERSIKAFLQQPSPVTTADGPVPPAELPEDALPVLALEDDIENLPNNGEAVDEAVDREPADETEEPADEPETFQVIIDLHDETSIPSARCLLLLRELDKSGDVLSSQPDTEALRSGAPGLQLKVWLRTSLTKDHIEEGLRSFAEVKRVSFVDDRRKDQRQAKVSTVRVRTDLLDQFVNLTGELITHRYILGTAAAARSWEEMGRALAQTGRLIDDLHHNVLQARLMPLESVTGRLPRVVRDLARKSDKQVTLKVVGADVGIDRVVLEQLGDPLVHLVRNAIDHGIVEQGTVTITARREKDLVLVEVADDGCGMDPAQLRKKALEKGLLTVGQAEHMADRDALMLVCQPGFSTMATVTETSGRGVGMDVVKAAVENLGGSLDIQSAPGRGTRFQMRLPLSIAIIKVLLVACDGQSMAIPITRILRNLDLVPAAVSTSGPQRVFVLDEEQIPLLSLGPLLELEEPPVDDTIWVVLTEVHGRRVGLQVDSFLGQRDAFVKSLDFPLTQLPGLSGATIEGDGQILFIIDPHALLDGHPAITGPLKEMPHAVSPSE